MYQHSKYFIPIAARCICLAATGVSLCYGLWLLTRAFLFDRVITPTESMTPTLLPGDRIIASKTLTGARIYTDFDFGNNARYPAEISNIAMYPSLYF